MPKFKLDTQTKRWWRDRQRHTGHNIADVLPDGWVGTISDLFLIGEGLTPAAKLWAMSLPGVMPAKLQLLLSVKLAQALPQRTSAGRRCILPDSSIENLESYIFSGKSIRHIRNFNRPTILHNTDAAAGLSTLLQHFRRSNNRKSGAAGMAAFDRAAVRILTTALNKNIQP